MLATIDCAVYVERVILNNPANVRKAKKAIHTALDIQAAGLGFTFVEFLSACPTNWGMTPQKALQWIDEAMIPQYPLGVFRDKEA
jgi:2-oxoglutarate ferredoxin oxidoreductase subunit beta